MNESKGPIQVDAGAVLASKNAKLAKLIPKFVINVLKRLIHQDEINETLRKTEGLTDVEFIAAVLKDHRIDYTVYGAEKLDLNGRYIFAANHPLGGLDGMILLKAIADIFGKVKTVSNDLISSLEPLKNTFIPVNKYGRQTKESTKRIDDAYSSDEPMLYFPAGLCSRKTNGVIRDLPWHKNFIKQAIRHKRDIVPVYFVGKNSNTFYRAANIRKSLGIGFNYEMLLLPHEMFLQKNATFELFIGEPISWKVINSEGDATLWASKIEEICYSLKPKDGTSN